MCRTFRWLATAAAGITVAGAVACTSHAAPTAATATPRAAGTTTAPTAAAAAGRAAGPCGTTTTAPTYRHVIWIWFENHDIMGSSSAPYFNSIASKCGVATNYHNVTHPSLPNYVAATSGIASLEPFYSDCSPSNECSSSAPSIFGQGETWKAYEESMSSNCNPSNSGDYAVRHNPPAYYPALTTCSANDVPYPQLATDLASNALPAFSFITPNLIDDMHDGTIAQGNAWLSSNLPTILASPEYTSGSTAVFVTFDEGNDDGQTGENCVANTSDSSCHVLTIVISPSTAAGSTSATMFSHYSLLATTEQLLGLPALGRAASAATMTAAFNL
jgi:phospholipase C